MALLTKKTIRTKLDTSLDASSTLDIKIWKGNATDFEVGVFDGADVLSLAEVTSVNMKVQPSQVDDTTLMDSTVAAVDIDDTLTASTWDDGTKQHATFSFTNAQTNLAITCPIGTFWIVFTAILTGGEEVTLSAGVFELHEDNNETAGDPDVNPGSPLSIEEADARYVPYTGATGDVDLGANSFSATSDSAVSISGTNTNVSGIGVYGDSASGKGVVGLSTTGTGARKMRRSGRRNSSGS